MENPNVNTYSFSKIKSFISCPYAFFRNYFEKDRDKLDHGTSQFGTFCHKILELYEKGELETFEMLPYYLENYNKEITAGFEMQISPDYTKDFAFSYFESGKTYFENFTGFKDIEILESEYEFIECIEDKFNITGKIDLIAKNKKGDLMIIDHKSKANFKNKEELTEYARQLYMYAYAVKERYGEFPKQMGFNMFRKNKFISVPFKIEEFNATFDWLKQSVTTIENCIDFGPCYDDFYHNNFCPYRHNCQYRIIEDNRPLELEN